MKKKNVLIASVMAGLLAGVSHMSVAKAEEGVAPEAQADVKKDTKKADKKKKKAKAKVGEKGSCSSKEGCDGKDGCGGKEGCMHKDHKDMEEKKEDK